MLAYDLKAKTFSSLFQNLEKFVPTISQSMSETQRIHKVLFTNEKKYFQSSQKIVIIVLKREEIFCQLTDLFA